MNNDEYQKLFKRLMKIANIDEVVCEKDLFDDYVFHIKSSRLKIMRSQMLYYKRTNSIHYSNMIYSTYPIYFVEKFLIDYAIHTKSEIYFYANMNNNDTSLQVKSRIFIPKVNNLEELKIWIDLNEQ